jgi:hypothetical protein
MMLKENEWITESNKERNFAWGKKSESIQSFLQ